MKRSMASSCLFSAVLLISAILFMSTPLQKQQYPSRTSVARIQLKELEGALQMFEYDMGRYPTSAEGLDALVHDPGNLERWQKPYLTTDVPLDPWGRAYVYRCPGEHGNFDLFSYGRDGVEDGEGEDADIVSWQTATSGR